MPANRRRTDAGVMAEAAHLIMVVLGAQRVDDETSGGAPADGDSDAPTTPPSGT